MPLTSDILTGSMESVIRRIGPHLLGSIGGGLTGDSPALTAILFSIPVNVGHSEDIEDSATRTGVVWNKSESRRCECCSRKRRFQSGIRKITGVIMDLPSSFWEIVLRPLIALACGAALGFEREAAEKPAGLRTQMLVALGAATFTILTLRLYDGLQSDQSGLDPLRIISGVAGGIGFLGAGSIIRERGTVSGVTTAATIWVTGSVGIACGAGWYSIAVTVTLYALATLWLLGILERRFSDKKEKP